MVLLADATGSMQTADCTNGQSRLQILHDELVGPSADLRRRLNARYDNLRTYVFANDQPRELGPNADFDVLPGDTDLDGVLAAVHATDSSDTGIGLDDNDLSPSKIVSNFCEASKPVSSLALVPELPR